MLKTGHWGAALVCYAPVGWFLLETRPGLALAGGIGVLALARFPDVDLRLPLVSHRGPTHTLLFALGVGAVLAGVATLLSDVAPSSLDAPWLVPFAAFTGVFGIGTHLLADALTPSGVPLFWPLSRRRFSLRLVRANDALANWGLLGLGTVLTALAVLLR
ncbi:metal-dependent hydrolase [Halomarina oriensis]|uniref:Metal-dependent hydrolase n=1 Tax=Halomarina oriensis TaxID=671145 RepID=A0A6B0GML2_9EURY|nr:metal-dependent hydrolase [Halomarina oriensis]MWG36156.1 metal-dependent hydrolase [Halomarina oriensis]